MKKYQNYAEKAVKVIENIVATQNDKIEETIDIMFRTFQDGKSIFAFGATHAGIFTEESYARAGGLMIINPIFSSTLMVDTKPMTLTSDLERLEGFGTVLLNNNPIKEGDLLIIHSVSGRNAVGIDMAISAKAKGIYVIAITSQAYKDNIKSRHSSGLFLSDIADLNIDNCGEFGDACVAVDGEITAGATSTVACAAIANMLSVGFCEKCKENGIEPPVFESANKDRDDERTFRLITKYHKQIHYI